MAIFSVVVIGSNHLDHVHVRVSVIIPTHNEAQAIERVLADLPSDLTTEVIVVDSNSNDGTPEIAARMGARVVHEPRRGYGRACLTGLAMANSPDVVVFLDGDYSDRPSELPILLAPITEGRADITLGSRLQGRRSAGALPWHQVFGNRLAAGLIRLLFSSPYGLEISDLGPFRAGRADVLRALALEEATYGWAVEMILKGALAGFRVVEVPVSYYPRIGKSKISGTLKGTFGAAWFILSLIVRYYFRHRRAGTSRPTYAPVQGSNGGRAQGESAADGRPPTNKVKEELEPMAMATIKQYPDTSGCRHQGMGPVRRTGNFDVGYCPDCKFSIGFRLDGTGKRTGETKIIQIEEVSHKKQTPPQ